MGQLYLGDCLDIMPQLGEQSVDLILCDLPYGTTALKWDKVIDSELLWKQYKRIIKPSGIICLFAIQPFTSALIMSNLEMYRYSWVWEKDTPTGFLNCKYKPINLTEDIVVFSFGTVGSLSKQPITYYPQGVMKMNRLKYNNPNSTWRENKGYPSNGNVLNSDKEYIQTHTNYPTNILKFARDRDTIHPTQKPVALLEYLIKTYTKDGDVVLDNCMGSGSTCVACINTDRNYIGIEKDEKYFNLAKERIEKTSAPTIHKELSLEIKELW